MRKLVSVLILATMGSSALAQDSGVAVVGVEGYEIPLSPVALYRALGDRIVSGQDVIGNNRSNWSQVDSALPSSRIGVGVATGSDEATLLDIVRWGCREASGESRACMKVGLRQDRLIREGAEYAGVRFDATRVSQPVPAYTPPPAPPAPTYTMTTIDTQPLAPLSPAPETARVMESVASVASVVSARAEVVASPSAAMMVEPAPMEAMVEVDSDFVFATRLFAARGNYPPKDYAAYGLVAFRSQATADEADRQRHMHICEAFFATLTDSGSSDAPVTKQMVTVWPILAENPSRLPDYPENLLERLNTPVREEGMCDLAVTYYDLFMAKVAIKQVEAAQGAALPGAGPYLLAWSPGAKKGQRDAVVLVADLENVQSAADAREAFGIWREHIERDATLWEDGFTEPGLKVKLRKLLDRYGDQLMKFVTG